MFFWEWGKQVQTTTGYQFRTLNNEEWNYLLESRHTNAADLYRNNVTVCGRTGCLVILPDNWKWNTEGSEEGNVGSEWRDNYDDITPGAPHWSDMEAAGAVCLPAAGVRGEVGVDADMSDVDEVGYTGNYWTASLGKRVLYRYA